MNPGNGNSSLAFDCRIGYQSSLRKYVFDIEWFINDANMKTNKTKIEYNWLKRDGTLYMNDWNKGGKTKIGFHVRFNKTS